MYFTAGHRRGHITLFSASLTLNCLHFVHTVPFGSCNKQPRFDYIALREFFFLMEADCVPCEYEMNLYV